MKYTAKFFALLLILFGSASLCAQGNFFNSLHGTRTGKNYWYGKDTNAPTAGFESLTDVPISELGCVQCHPADGLDANGDPYPDPYSPNCVDCHATKSGFTVTEDDCYGCHSRQKTEKETLNYSDVHREASTPLKCWNCHSKEEIHGDDGVSYNSLLQEGAIKANCEQCHSSGGPAPFPDHSGYDPHSGKLHCDACHSQSVISCYNCHFESQVEAHVKRAKQPIHDFVILVNREKDGKVGTASFQSLTYQGNAWVAFAPYHAHTITGDGRTCSECHLNFGGQVEAIKQYNETGQIKFVTWDEGSGELSWIHGVIPMPEDFQETFKMDFITYNGTPSDPPDPSVNWSLIGKDSWDGYQMLFATPLSRDQMMKLGFVLTGIEEGETAGIPSEFILRQNYPNPFNPATSIEFVLPHSTQVTVKIYNLLGEELHTLLLNEKMSPGSHTVHFRADNLGSGVYLYQMMTPEFTVTKKMVLLK